MLNIYRADSLQFCTPYPQVRRGRGELVVQGTVMSDHESVPLFKGKGQKKKKKKGGDATPFPLTLTEPQPH